MANNSASDDLVSFNSFKFNHGQTKNVFAVMGIWTPYLLNGEFKTTKRIKESRKKELPDLLEIFGSFLVPSSNISNYFIMMKARKGQNYLSEISSNRRNSGNSVLHPSGQQDLMSNQYRFGQSPSHCPKRNMIEKNKASDNEGKFHSFLKCRIWIYSQEISRKVRKCLFLSLCRFFFLFLYLCLQ